MKPTCVSVCKSCHRMLKRQKGRHTQHIHNHSGVWSYCVYVQAATLFCSDIRKSFKTSICRDSQREPLQGRGTRWETATLPVMNSLYWKRSEKRSREEKSPLRMCIRQPIPCWSGISWTEAKQRAGEWTMKLIKTLFIHLKVNFQYDWAANTLMPNLKVCEAKKRDPNINSEQIPSSNPAPPRHQGRIWLVLLTSAWSRCLIS